METDRVMKYIDSEKLIAEIERLIGVHTSLFGALDEVAMNLDYIKKLIISLKQEQPEVDLEKEFQEYWYLHQYEQRLKRQVVDGHGRAVLRNAAGHFYELGLNARKED